VSLVVTVTLIQAVLAALTRELPLFGLPLSQASQMPAEAVGQFASATSLGRKRFAKLKQYGAPER
tara:strand:- start:260 stop:454 length:195 start_codon:yes stop_codon:yes gene_type:complete